MRAFRYRLAAVLKRAEHAEQIIQIELARLQDQLTDAIQRLDTLHHLREDFHARLRRIQSGPPASPSQPAHGLDLDHVISLRRQLEQLGEALTRAALLRRQLEDGVASARARLLEAARSRQTFENHRDGLTRIHRSGELASEAKHLDDLANARSAAHAGPGRASNHGPHPHQEEGRR